MIVYRITSAKYADQLTASRRAGRWNLTDQYVLYASSSRSLATLEMLVNRSNLHPKVDYKVMLLSVPDQFDTYEVRDLPENWRSLAAYSKLQGLGSFWYNHGDTALLRIPSAVIPQEHNYLMNTRHVDFKEVAISDVEDYFWDERLK
ncbi:MAG: RES family NAD+ phosphorylase [Cyclobacteriaceae bacterium]